uniref:Uncharacterized protein n=1 Tax=Panagrolaimus sp. PS1159 TaxID=55785 RepID=A0AC35GF49_9BILA
MPDQFDDNADWSSLEKNESEEEKQKHVSHHHCRSSPTNSIINVLTTSPFADNGDDAFNESLVSQVSIARTFDNCRRSFSDVTQQLDQFDDNYSDSDDENVILERRRKNRLSAVLENPNITSSCSKQYREKIQNSFSDATVMPDKFDDEWSSSEKNESKNL